MFNFMDLSNYINKNRGECDSFHANGNVVWFGWIML